MGGNVSKPARKFQGTIAKSNNLKKTPAQRIQLPSQALKDKFEFSATEPALSNKDAPIDGDISENVSSLENVDASTNTNPVNNVPEGKDGMDPQADQNFIKFINNLGRQIHSHADQKPGDQSDVRALKQLLNRKKLYEKGQDEVKAQLETSQQSRSMIHPRTLTAIIFALNDPRVKKEDIAKDYSIHEDFLKDLSRFKVAENVVVIEETTKADEIGPKVGQPVARAASDPSLMNENGTVSEGVNQDRLRRLRSRLE